MSGKKINFSNTKDERLVSYIGQDICRAENNANAHFVFDTGIGVWN